MQKTGRVRRTKAEIEAAAGETKAVEVKADKPAANGAIDFEELKLFAQEKAQDEANVPKIKAKLKELGVTKTKELADKPELHNAYWVFLQAL